MRRLFSKLTAVALALIMAATVPVTAFAEGGAVAGSDKEPPKFVSLRFEKSVLSAGETQDIYVDVTDNLAGVLRLQLYLRNKETGVIVSNASLEWDREEDSQAALDAYGDIPVKLVNGYYHAKWSTKEWQPAGEYEVLSIDMIDKADNGTVVSAETVGKSFTLNNTFGNQDTTPPKVNSITIKDSITEVKVPGNVTFISECTDDISGVHSAWIHLRNKETGHVLMEGEGGYHGDIDKCVQRFDLDELIGMGDYYISKLFLEDEAGNRTVLFGSGAEEYEEKLKTNSPDLLPEKLRNIKITVVGGNDKTDTEPPVFNDISLSADSIEAPGTVLITIDALDKGKGLAKATLRLKNPDDNQKWSTFGADTIIDCVLDESDGKLKGIAKFNNYAVAGEYSFKSIRIEDKAGNYIVYQETDPRITTPMDNRPDNLKSKKLTVTNRQKQPDEITDVNGIATAIENIKNSGTQDALVVAEFENASGKATVGKNVFDDIKQTEATVEFVSNGITWQFDGAANQNYQPSEQPQDQIDLSATVDSNKNAEKVKELAGTNKETLIVDFNYSGYLPAKATVKIDADFERRQKLGDSVDIYHYNDNGTPDTADDKLDSVASNVSVGADGTYGLPIEHCSSYVIVSKPKSKPSQPSGGSGSYSGGSSSGSTVSTSTPSGTTSPASFAEQYNEKVSETSDIINAIAAGNDIFAGGLQPGVIINFGGGTTVTAETTADGRTETVINYSTGDALPLSIMDSLKNSKDVRFVFSYSYQGVDYKVEITSEEAAEVLDPSIPWYGPLWLYGQFSPEAKAARKAAKEAAKAQK